MEEVTECDGAAAIHVWAVDECSPAADTCTVEEAVSAEEVAPYVIEFAVLCGNLLVAQDAVLGFVARFPLVAYYGHAGAVEHILDAEPTQQGNVLRIGHRPQIHVVRDEGRFRREAVEWGSFHDVTQPPHIPPHILILCRLTVTGF